MIFNINVLNILQIKKQSFKENVHYCNFNQTLNIYITSLKLINMKKYLLISLFILILTSTIAVSAVDFENTTIKGLNITTDYDGALSEAQSQNKSTIKRKEFLMNRSYFLLQGLKEIISILQAQKNGKLQIVDDERDIKSPYQYTVDSFLNRLYVTARNGISAYNLESKKYSRKEKN